MISVCFRTPFRPTRPKAHTHTHTTHNTQPHNSKQNGLTFLSTSKCVRARPSCFSIDLDSILDGLGMISHVCYPHVGTDILGLSASPFPAPSLPDVHLHVFFACLFCRYLFVRVLSPDCFVFLFMCRLSLLRLTQRKFTIGCSRFTLLCFSYRVDRGCVVKNVPILLLFLNWTIQFVSEHHANKEPSWKRHSFERNS